MESATILAIVLLVLGAIAAVSEMHTLTIYLLAVALACFASAAVALAGGGLTLALIVLAIVSLLGMPIAHILRKRLLNEEAEQVSHDDIGGTVKVLGTLNGRLRVSYRGSTWDARLAGTAQGALAKGETCRITSRDGNVLIISPQAGGKA